MREETQTRKNTALRMACGLAVAAILSTCVVAGTFAKYTTVSSATDTARVAKWGFANDANSQVMMDDLFKSAYDKNVKGAADVIAPGTANASTFKMVYNTADGAAAAPEVAYTFSVNTDGSSCAEGIKNNPNIQWRLDDGAWGSWEQAMAQVRALSGDPSGSKAYAAGELPSGFYGADAQTAGAGAHTIAWQWLYGDGYDKLDTALGNADELGQVAVKIAVSATQID